MLDQELGRRRLLRGLVALGAGGLMAGVASATAPTLISAPLGERRIAFRNVHNNERIDARFFGPSGFDVQGMAEINHGLRDWRTNETARMDPQLMLLLATLRDRLGVAPQRAFDLISGYRSPHTNASLRAKGGAHTGVATKSQHMLGKATDIALPGVPLATVQLAALTMRRGGVGYYPRDGFVHVDTGRVRSW